MPSDLLPFGSVKECPKCGGRKLFRDCIRNDPVYHDGGWCNRGEHIMISCPKCYHTWFTQCADAQGGKARNAQT